MTKNMKDGLLIAGLGVGFVIALKLYNDAKAKKEQDNSAGDNVGMDGSRSKSGAAGKGIFSPLTDMVNDGLQAIRKTFHPK